MRAARAAEAWADGSWEAGVPRTVDKASEPKLKALGNAIVPQVAEQFIRAVMMPDELAREEIKAEGGHR